MSGAQPREPFRNPDLDPEARITDLLSRLTIEEKVACLGTNPSIPRLSIVASGHVEGLHGLAQGGPAKWGRENGCPTTTFPQQIGLGETWDPELVREAATLEAIECRYVFHTSEGKRGGLVVRAPNADIGRDPRWGRTEECFGEDAFFNGVMTAQFVRGLQGDHPRYWRTASLMKHFLANSNEDERERSSSSFDERLLREYYSVAFRKGVEAGSRAFMAAYNSYNGVPCTVHPMLETMARTEWGQDGIICTDGGAFRLLVEKHRYYPDLVHAAAACLRAGINQFLDKFTESVQAALDRGLLVEADLDRAIRPVFRVMLRLGLLDPPELCPHTRVGTSPPWELETSRALVRRVTEKSIVLLKNDGVLPLDASRVESIAVVGPLSNDVLLDWYSGTPPYVVTPFDGIVRRAGDRVRVTHSAGGAEAVALARAADVAIVCIGNDPTCGTKFGVRGDPGWGKEAVDRLELGLSDESWALEVLEANPRSIVVLISSFPFAIERTQARAVAILHVTHNSQELGSALAGALFGDVNPGGRLVQTWPRRVEDLPPMMDYELRHGRTYLYSECEPLYPFGYGLSYTHFTYSNLSLGAEQLAPGDVLEVALDVTNAGGRAGDDVIQLYVRHVDSGVKRPIRELKAFRRITLEAGETRRVRLEVPASELAYWDAGTGAFVLETGEIEIGIGRNATAIELSAPCRVVGTGSGL